MSQRSGENAPLVSDEENQIMNTLRYSATNGNVTIQEGASPVLVTSKSEAQEVNKHSMHSTHSDNDPENSSLMGSVVQPQDLQELMANLEKATVLVRRYLNDNPEVTFGERRYVQLNASAGNMQDIELCQYSHNSVLLYAKTIFRMRS